MKTIFEFKTLTDFTDYFNNEDVCRQHFAETRFRNGEYCPHCNHDKIYTFKGGKRYRCAKCKQDFKIMTGTVFGESKLPIRTWYMAIYLLGTTSKGISSVQLAKHLGVTQKTAWFMAHRIRSAKKQSKGKLLGTVEADETYIGGKAKNMHRKQREASEVGTGGKGKTPVFGMKSREGEVRAQVIAGNDSATLHPIITANVEQGVKLYTDEHRAYNGLGKQYVRQIIRHGMKEFVKGDCHTNGIESFWALFKRGYMGVYHQMSNKHLQRYVNEFAFRFNRKTEDMQSVFEQIVTSIAETAQLPYKELTKEIA